MTGEIEVAERVDGVGRASGVVVGDGDVVQNLELTPT